ncbi:hypothetical protein BDB00DRAFT_801507 [Zychaea mexicana]|uniref:uncharacterized protein n=1 Tax=Zychaea mexicana TaxID=64656 RepID=UPI0022FDE13B|nr:uncharacterized protein BDB00DRAFT_801507 [Zychaea mexicana]KAI9498184.1 hypothetical protein BDB00DRAFT_801507 [Zychaea mexicana]
MSSVVPHYVHSVASVANGIFAGLGLTISTISILTLRVAGNPVVSWVTTYKSGSVIAVSSIFASSTAHFYTY